MAQLGFELRSERKPHVSLWDQTLGFGSNHLANIRGILTTCGPCSRHWGSSNGLDKNIGSFTQLIVIELLLCARSCRTKRGTVQQEIRFIISHTSSSHAVWHRPRAQGNSHVPSFFPVAFPMPVTTAGTQSFASTRSNLTSTAVCPKYHPQQPKGRNNPSVRQWTNEHTTRGLSVQWNILQS